jgi:L-ascorbate 6-phosphate lactonase
MTTHNGRALIEQINRLAVPGGHLALWFLGQSGMVLKGGETIVYVDPYLRGEVRVDQRRFPPPVQPGEVTNAQIVFCTHEHGDHTDDRTLGPLAQASPQAVFVGPANSRDIMRQVGIADERIHVPKVGERQTLGGVTYTAVPAAHYGLDYDEARGYRWLGYIFELNGVTLYHAGDTILFDGLEDHLKGHTFDIMALPINGRDGFRERRNIVGNFTPQEAVGLIKAIGTDVFIPLHNDLFLHNRNNPAILTDVIDRELPFQKYHWLQAGELYYYVKG